MGSKLELQMAAAKIESLIRLTARGRRFAVERRAIEASGLFDRTWYSSQPFNRGEPRDAILHYLVVGARRGLNPHPLFDTEWYRSKAALPSCDFINPLAHFLSEAAEVRVDPSPLFNGAWYRAQHPEIAYSGLDAFSYYVKIGAHLGHSTTPLFDPISYAASNTDVPLGDGFDHFVRYGLQERRNPNPYFNSDWYEATYHSSGQAPLVHYLTVGQAKNNDPGPLFDTFGYRFWYSHLIEKDQDALSNYLAAGRKRGFSRFDPRVFGFGKMRVAVIAHLYYDDLWPQIAQALLNIPVSFDLYVTIPSDRIERLSRQVLSAIPDAKIIDSICQGRDIGPFFQALTVIADNNISYDAICKIHTKKGVTEPDVWRYILLQSVLGNQRMIGDIIRTFQTQPKVGLIGPKDLYISGPKFIGPNGPNVSELAKSLYPNYDRNSNWGFFAGSMFWFRPMLLRRLAHHVREKISFELDGDGSRNDGQMAHAFERMIGMIASLEGLDVGLVDLAGQEGDDVPILVGSAQNLIAQEEPADYLARQAKLMRGLYTVV